MNTSRKRPTAKETISTMVAVMNGKRGFGNDGLEPWPESYLVVQESDGRRRAYQSDDQKVLSEISIDGIAAGIYRYNYGHQDPPFDIDVDLATKIAKTYLISSKVIDEPKLVREFDEPGYCFHRHPYILLDNVCDEAMEGCCPLFSDMLGRIKYNREAFACFIGSLFVENSPMQQYLVLKGEGGDGKSSMLNRLAEFFGPTYAASSSEKVKSLRWTTDTYQKRVVAFSDAQNLSFLNSEIFKTLTGGDSVSYMPLYKNAFTGRSEAKVIVCTNDDVDVTGMLSDRRRRIYVEIGAPESVTPFYEKELAEESQVFFSWCRWKYLQKYGDQQQAIEVEGWVENELEENSWDHFDAFFDQYCKPGGNCRRADVYRLFKNVCSRDNKEFKKFKYYLRKRYAVNEKRLDVWWFEGIGLRQISSGPILVKQ